MGRTEALAVFLTLEGLGPPVGAEVGVGPLEESGHLARTSWLNSRTFLAGRESLWMRKSQEAEGRGALFSARVQAHALFDFQPESETSAQTQPATKRECLK